ncbi:unnamed protein product [Protopolystoma xenopodis]|uniref:Uncharacterized protein n=1 Tax=Protopolystoma xenopodis TaxID=117903 RepID=A0A3S5C6C7_9PLAT|nr:unnamed protein product [Protopolystoma xenopodis]
MNNSFVIDQMKRTLVAPLASARVAKFPAITSTPHLHTLMLSLSLSLSSDRCMSAQCANLMLIECIPKAPLAFHILPFDNPKAQRTLKAPSLAVKLIWCREIKRLILDNYDALIPEKAKQIVLNMTPDKVPGLGLGLVREIVAEVGLPTLATGGSVDCAGSRNPNHCIAKCNGVVGASGTSTGRSPVVAADLPASEATVGLVNGQKSGRRKSTSLLPGASSRRSSA